MHWRVARLKTRGLDRLDIGMCLYSAHSILTIRVFCGHLRLSTLAQFIGCYRAQLLFTNLWIKRILRLKILDQCTHHRLQSFRMAVR